MSKYFNIVKIKPGKVIVPTFGAIDFAQPLSDQLLFKLHQHGVPYLELTKEGKEHYFPTKKTSEKPSKKKK